MNIERVKYAVQNSMYQINRHNAFAQINANINGNLKMWDLKMQNSKEITYSVKTVEKDIFLVNTS